MSFSLQKAGFPSPSSLPFPRPQPQPHRTSGVRSEMISEANLSSVTCGPGSRVAASFFFFFSFGVCECDGSILLVLDKAASDNLQLVSEEESEEKLFCGSMWQNSFVLVAEYT